MRGRKAAPFEDMWIPEPNSGCWIWLRCLDRRGYGWMTVNGKTMFAHRRSWVLHRGPLADDACVLHRCDTRCCVNPWHLFLGSRKDNSLDAQAKDRIRHSERHGRAKLTNAQVVAIYRRAHAGERRRALANEFGVSVGTIDLIVTRKKWVKITESLG